MVMDNVLNKKHNNKTKEFAIKVAKQNAKCNKQFAFDSSVMTSKKHKVSKFYTDHFGNAVNAFEYVIRNNKKEIDDRLHAITLQELIIAAEKTSNDICKQRKNEAAKNSDDAKLLERNMMNFNIEVLKRKIKNNI